MKIILFFIASLLTCSVFAQVQPYEIEYAPADKYILLSKLSPSGEYDHALLSTIGLSEFDDDISLWESTGTYSVSIIGAPLENILLGTDAGNSITTGNYNFITGTNLPNTSSTSYNTGIGYRNLYASFASNYATGIGRENLFSATSSNYATGIGRENMYNATNVVYATGIGHANMYSATSAIYATGIGGSNMYTATTADYATGIGRENMYLATSASYATGIGYRNMYSGTNTAYSTGIGRDNVYNATSAIYTTGIGYRNMYNATSADHATGIGRENLFTVTTADYATGIGRQNMYSATSATSATGIGYRNMYSATNAVYATGIGYQNMYNATSANYAIAIGRENGYNAASQNNSIYLGYRQAYTTGADYRLHIGMYQDNPLIYGEFDNAEVEIGGKLGYTTEGGTAISLVGKDADDKLTTTDVGDLVKANGLWTESGTDLYYTAGNIGIGTNSPQSTLDVNGTLLLSNPSGNSITGFNMIKAEYITDESIVNIGSIRSSGNLALMRGLKPSPTVANGYLSSVDNVAFNRSSLEVGSDLIFKTKTNDTTPTDSLVTLTERFRITTAGRVGIGTSSPTEQIHVDGNALITGSIEYQTQGGSATSLLGQDATGKLTTTDVSTLLDADYLQISDTASMLSNYALNSDIPTIPTDHLTESTSFSGDVSGIYTNLQLGTDVVGVAEADEAAINYWSKTGSDVYYSSGDIGIGTNSPRSILETEGTISINDSQTSIGDGDSLSGIEIYTSEISYIPPSGLLNMPVNRILPVSETSIGDAFGMAFYTADKDADSAEKMRLDSDGNLVIGSTSASAKLDVVGNAEINGDAEVNGELFVTDAISSGGTVDAQLFLTSNDQVVERSIKYESGYRRTATKVIGTTSTDIDGWTEMYDVDNKYSISSASITIPTNGTYKISFNADITGTTQTKEYEVQLWNATDGVQVRLNEFTLLIDSTDGVDNGHCHAQFIETLTASKTYKIRMKERTGNSGSLLLVDTSMSIELKAESI